MSLKPYYSCAELAAMKLPGLPGSERGMRDYVTAKGWASRQVPGKGGKGGMRMEYQPPADIYNLILSARSPAAIVAAPAETAVAEIKPSQNLAALDQDQRDCDIARARLVAFIEGYRGANKSGMVRPAIAYLNTERAAGRLSPALSWAFDNAWSKKRPGQQLNAKTFYNWLTLKQQTGSFAPGKRQKDYSVKPWHALAIALKKRPQGSQLTWIAAQVEAQWEAAWGEKPKDLYNVLYRFFNEKFSQLDQLKGRYTGSQLRSHKFYQHRTADGYAPADEVHADGWNTHFSAPHPETGEFVTYEVWHFHDVATRYVPEPGIGLTENAEVIAKGLENCIRELGVMVHMQTDSTKVVKGSDRFTKAMHSLEERLGFVWVHPKEVGNSQANGICENFNTSWLDKRSRELATYQNKNSMDDLTFKRVKKLTAEMVKAASAGDDALRLAKKLEVERMGKGMVFESYEQARAWIKQIHHEFNDRPHSSLKKIRDPATGKMRHQTPREALNEHRANGWEPVWIGGEREGHEAHLIDAFRPHKVVKVTRETVSPYGGMRYRNAGVLGHWNGKQVVVAYDIDDSRQVWVKDLKGALICVAEFVSATGYREMTAREAGEQKRAQAQIRNKERGIETIRARTPGIVLEGEGSRIEALNELFPLNTESVKQPEKVLTFMDFLPEAQEVQAQEPTFMDTMMMLFDAEVEDQAKETATGG